MGTIFEYYYYYYLSPEFYTRFLFRSYGVIHPTRFPLDVLLKRTFINRYDKSLSCPNFGYGSEQAFSNTDDQGEKNVETKLNYIR